MKSSRFRNWCWVAAVTMVAAAPACADPAFNGFDVSNANIPREEILRGGPPRDGIPSIDEPKFVPAARVDYLRDDDIVIGLEREGIARACPLRILVWHQIVNDRIGDDAVVVTYCPLCGTSMVFWFAWQAFYPETSLWSP